jgi:hypothetical protein
MFAPGKVMDVKLRHVWKALFPMEDSVDGSAIDFRPEPLNALAPMLWSVLGIVAPITFALFKKADAAIAVAVDGKVRTPKEPV